MPAAYDTYDYPSYWEGREYEHSSEVLALKSLLNLIPTIKSILEVGSGYGRLVPTYAYRAKKVTTLDPSAKLLKMAKRKNPDKKINYLQSTLENLNKKVRGKSQDLVICVRVAHHIKDLDSALTTLNKVIKNNGYLILEFPNKRHAKASFTHFVKGDFTYTADIFPKDLSSKKSVKAKALPFVNYHPDIVKDSLKGSGFKVIKTLSVSNIRSPRIKNMIPTETLLFFEKYLQAPLGTICFGPSIFILAQKK